MFWSLQGVRDSSPIRSNRLSPPHLGEEVEAAQAAHNAVHLRKALPLPLWLEGNRNSYARNRDAIKNLADSQRSFCCSSLHSSDLKDS